MAGEKTPSRKPAQMDVPIATFATITPSLAFDESTTYCTMTLASGQFARESERSEAISTPIRDLSP